MGGPRGRVLDRDRGRAAPRDSALAALRDSANRALALDPGLAEAHLRLANYYFATGDRSARTAHVQRALELEPGNPMSLAVASDLAMSAGRLDEAVALQRRAVEADPLPVVQRYNLAWLLYVAARWAEADQELTAVHDLTRDPERVAGLRCLVAVADGRFVDARELADAIPRDVERQQCLALALHGLGRAADADAALRSLVQSAGDRHYVEIAEVHAFRGDADRAFEWLERATSRSLSNTVSPSERPRPGIAQHSPLMRALHADPRWPAVLQEPPPIRLNPARASRHPQSRRSRARPPRPARPRRAAPASSRAPRPPAAPWRSPSGAPARRCARRPRR